MKISLKTATKMNVIDGTLKTGFPAQGKFILQESDFIKHNLKSNWSPLPVSSSLFKMNVWFDYKEQEILHLLSESRHLDAKSTLDLPWV